jgi:PIN domain nuclease of toxin-antitoxin system
MKLLLDTNVILWWLTDDARLGPKARSYLIDGTNELFVSIASLWEVSIKHSAGKLSATAGLIASWLNDLGIAVIPVEVSHLSALEQLERLHRDPFDRLILAQAQVEGARVVTSDTIMRQYPVPCISAD